MALDKRRGSEVHLNCASLLKVICVVLLPTTLANQCLVPQNVSVTRCLDSTSSRVPTDARCKALVKSVEILHVHGELDRDESVDEVQFPDREETQKADGFLNFLYLFSKVVDVVCKVSKTVSENILWIISPSVLFIERERQKFPKRVGSH